MMLTTREIEKRNQYGKICRYLETVFKNCGKGYDLYELIDYDPSMPEDVRSLLEDSLENETALYNFAEEKYKNMKLKHELKELQKKIDIQTKKLNKAIENFLNVKGGYT